MSEESIAGAKRAAPDSERRGRTSVRGRRWRMFAGGCVVALFAAVGAVGCSMGGPELSELQPGDCFAGQPYFYPPDIEVIDCAEANPTMDTMVVFAENAAGDSYPGDLDDMNARCASEGGMFLSPSSETWDDGDRAGLCFTSVVFAESFE